MSILTLLNMFVLFVMFALMTYQEYEDDNYDLYESTPISTVFFCCQYINYPFFVNLWSLIVLFMVKFLMTMDNPRTEEEPDDSIQSSEYNENVVSSEDNQTAFTISISNENQKLLMNQDIAHKIKNTSITDVLTYGQIGAKNIKKKERQSWRPAKLANSVGESVIPN